MPAPRFCASCGSRAQQGARFCSDCGARLDGGAAPQAVATGGGLRINAAGGAVLGAFLVVGLGIWTAILSPAPVKAPLGASAAPKGGGAPQPSGDFGPDDGDGDGGGDTGAQTRKLIDDLDRKAKADPKDIETWNKLGLVYVLAAQRDPSFYPQARTTFEHVLEVDPKQTVALRGLANVHHGRGEYRKAIEYYERYLAEKTDDDAVRAEMGTAYLSAGDVAKARSIYEAVLAKTPSHLEAQYFLAKAMLQQGDEKAALAAFKKARDLASDDAARRQIDTDIASITGEAPAARPAANAAPGSPSSTPLQQEVEKALRAAPIMGERMVRLEWTGPVTARAVVTRFPMSGMPPEVREKFLGRLNEQLKGAQQRAGGTDVVRVDITDDATQETMATLSTGSPAETPPAVAPAAAPAPVAPKPAAPAADGAVRTPFQTEVEKALREAPIMGDRIVSIDWPDAFTGRAVVANFPMAAMPEAVRDKFTTRIRDAVALAQTHNRVSGGRVELVDQASQAVMATIAP